MIPTLTFPGREPIAETITPEDAFKSIETPKMEPTSRWRSDPLWTTRAAAPESSPTVPATMWNKRSGEYAINVTHSGQEDQSLAKRLSIVSNKSRTLHGSAIDAAKLILRTEPIFFPMPIGHTSLNIEPVGPTPNPVLKA